MSDSLMYKDSRPAGAEHNFHFTSRSFAGIELKNCLTRGFPGKVFGSLLPEKEVQGNAAATAGASASRIAIGFCNAGSVQAGKRLGIFRERAVRTDNQNGPQFVGIVGADFLNTRIVRPRGFIGTHD